MPHILWLGQVAVRDICAEFGRRMVAAGMLDGAAGIAYLSLEELSLWGFRLSDPLRPRVARRKVEHQANRQVTPPDFIGASLEPQPWVDRYSGPPSPQEAGAGKIRGVGASAGVARGPAHVARTLHEAQALRPGEILVAVSPDPNWPPPW